MGTMFYKNRVFVIESLQELLDNGKKLLSYAMDISENIESEINSLKSIGSRIPGEAKDSAFLAKVNALKGTLSKPEFEDCYDHLQINLSKLISDIPEADSSVAQVVRDISDITGQLDKRITDLRSLIGNPEMAKDFNSFLVALEECKRGWESTNEELEAILNKIKASLKGLEQETCQYSADPVNLATGNFVYDKIDLMINGVHPLIFKRIYNSMDDSIGGFGRKWSHNFEIRLVKHEQSNTITVIFEDSHEEVFNKETDSYISFKNDKSKLFYYDDKYILKTANYNVYLFLNTGECIKKIDAKGNLYQFTHKDGRLKSITNLCGEIYLSYQKDGFISKVIDSSGRTQIYTYINERLVKVEDEMGAAISYEYDQSGNIISVINEQNICQVKNAFDEKGRTTLQTFPDGGIMKYDYLDQKDAICLTQQNGNQITYIHDNAYRNTRITHEDGEEIYQYDKNGRKISYTDKLGNKTYYEYNANGDLSKVIDPIGNVTTITYNSKRKPISICQKDGTNIHNFYNNKGYLIKSIDPLGRAINYSFGNESRPKMICFSDNSKYKMTYDNKENITSITDSLGNTTYYEYDSLNRIIKTIDAKGSEMHYEFDRNHRITKVTNANGDCRHYLYNLSGEVIKFIDFDGSCYQMFYNELNKLSKSIDPLGNITTYEYDSMWNISTVTAANGAKTKYQYNTSNKLSEKVTEDGAKTAYQYDANGNMIAVTYPNEAVIQFEYDALNRNTTIIDEGKNRSIKEYDCMGRVTRISDDFGHEYQFEYDLAGQLIKKTDALGNCVLMTYTRLGKIETYTDVNGNVTYYEYYPGGKLKRLSKPDGKSTYYVYDENGNIQSKTAENGLQVFYKYDSLNRLIEIIDSFHRSKKFEYDAVNNVTAVIDENGNKTAYTYQPMKRLIGVTDALGHETHYDYDCMGRLIGVSHSQDLYEEALELNGQTIVYDRDALGRIITMTDALGNQEFFQYDLMGKVIGHTDKNGNKTKFQYNDFNRISHIAYADGKSVEYCYNELKQLTQIKDWLGVIRINKDTNGFVKSITDHNNQTVQYEYNQFGQRTAIHYPNDKEITYSYDHLNRLININNSGNKINYQYGENDKLIEKIFNNGIKTTYSYNALGQLTKLMNYDKEGILDQYDYEYDQVGNKTRIEKFRRHMESDSGIFEYEYDAMNHLVNVFKDEMPLRSYSYDGLGNRTHMIEGNKFIDYTYNVAGQLVATKEDVNETKYVYDQCGNLETILTNGVISDSFKYDMAGHMVFANDKEFIYNGIGNKMGDTDGSYIIDMTKRYHNILMKNENMYLWDMSILGDNDSLYLQDELGSPIRRINQDGKLIESYAYDEFGEKQHKGNGQFTFTGYEDVNGICFAQARFYMPSLGRFLSKDKIKGRIIQPFTMNEYAYVYNNPLKYVDLDGNFPSLNDIADGFSDVTDWIGDACSDAGDYIADTVSAGADYVMDGISTGMEYLSTGLDIVSDGFSAGVDFIEQNIWDPAISFLDDNIFVPPSQWKERFTAVKCYFANNTFNDVLNDLNNVTNGWFKNTAYSIITQLAKWHIPDRIEQAYHSVIPAPVRSVVDGAWCLDLYLFNWTMDKVVPSSAEEWLINDFGYPVTGYALGFNYDPEKDIYYTTEGSLQQQFGFGPGIDELGPLLGMDLEEQPIVFEYNEREYLLEPWMGKYGGGISTGAEIGIYSRSKEEAEENLIVEVEENFDVFYHSAMESEQLLITYELIDRSTGEVVYDINTADYTGYDYWALGIKSFDNTDKEDLVMKATIQHDDPGYLNAMAVALNSNDNIDAYVKNGVLSFTWDPNENISSQKDRRRN